MTRWTVVVVAALVGGCAEALAPPAREEERSLLTDRLVYELRGGGGESLSVSVPFTYTNRTGKTVYAARCYGEAPSPVFEKLVDGDWASGGSVDVSRCLGDPIVIKPGERYTDTLTAIYEFCGMMREPDDRIASIVGTYRLVLHGLFHDYDAEKGGFALPVPLEDRTSNSFVLREK